MLFSACSACLLAGNWSVLHALVELAHANPTASHTILVPFITLVLIYERRNALFTAAASFDRLGVGVALLGMGALSAGRVLGASDGSGNWLGVTVAGLVILWVGGFLFFYGRNAVRAASFPLLFLCFTIPIPNALLDPATAFLKTGSAKTVAGLFTLTGTPFYENGFVFALPKFVIEIADECSGIRSSIALMLTGLLAANVFLARFRSKALLVAAVLPLAILKNGIRIVALSLLAAHVDPAFLTGQLHHEGGFAFFLLVLPILALIIVALRWSETRARRAGDARIVSAAPESPDVVQIR